MDAPLFRPQALAARRSREVGEPMERPPASERVMAFAAVAVVVGLMVLVCTVELPRRATVRGYLAPGSGVVRLRSPVAGSVVAWRAREGDLVVAGQPLLDLESHRATRSTPDVNAATAQDLQRLRDELVHQRRLAQASLEADLAQLERRDAALRREVATLATQLEVARERIRLAARRADELAPLAAQGLLPAAQLLQQRDRVEELRAESLRAEQALLERTRTLGELDAERGSRGRQTRARLAELESALGRVALEGREAEQRRDAVIHATTAGKVLRFAARPGAPVQPGQTVATIAPADAPLRAVLLVPSRAVGMLVRGQAVVMRFDAFPHQRFGTRRARVLSVGASVALPGELDAPLAFTEPMFEVIAALDVEEVTAYGRRWALRTDLTFEADVQLERATLAARLLDPLRAFAGQGG